ncbi:hypothetical protein RJT34_03326 [Clitoria ternatea]|uniref:C2H2-type domain-containing protein n=1 Tax=Clitoria ternatea TaxID=43366 RepID=A0AAN9KLX6_CLITE
MQDSNQNIRNNNTESLQMSLHNLSLLSARMDSLQTFISQSIKSHTLLTHHQMTTVSNEILTAIHHVITNAATLVAASNKPTTTSLDSPKHNENDTIIELDAVELLAKHFHYCEICGKGFTRDANLRMHMRPHGDEFKTPEALAKRPCVEATRLNATRFSCPYEGCNRNKLHEKFRSLKSVFCLRNHFKRRHCPKTMSCDRCRKKSFAVLSDLKSHEKQCRGESTWKDKLFGHVALLEGHLPVLEEKEKVEESDDLPDGFFDGLDDFGFGCLQEEPSLLKHAS